MARWQEDQIPNLLAHLPRSRVRAPPTQTTSINTPTSTPPPPPPPPPRPEPTKAVIAKGDAQELLRHEKRRRTSTPIAEAESKTPWAPKLTIRDRPLLSSDRIQNSPITVTALGRAVLLPSDMATIAEMLDNQSWEGLVQANLIVVQHSFDLYDRMDKYRAELKRLYNENTKLAKTINVFKCLNRAHTYITNEARRETEVARSDLTVAEARMAELEAKQQELVDVANAKGCKDGFDKAITQLTGQVNDAFNTGHVHGWEAGLRAAGVPEDSQLFESFTLPIPISEQANNNAPPPPTDPANNNLPLSKMEIS